MTRLTQLPCLLALAAAFGCGDTQTPEVTQLTFDRPVDVAFACYGQMRFTSGGAAAQGQDIAPTAMPPSACEIRSQALIPLPAECQPDPADPKKWTLFEEPTPPGQETLREGCRTVSETGPVNWYGLILQSGPGTVAIAEFTTKPDAGDDTKVMDAAQFVPGKNSISVGEEPVAIHVDPAGCHAVTANAGSCDLSVLELNSVLDGIGTNGLAADPAVRVDRLEVRNAAGAPIRSRPAAMVGEPSETLIGNACEEKPRGLVYVAYPSCHLVAAVDTLTGTIVSGIQYDAAGTPTIVGGDVTCPDECGGGATATPGVRPVTLDLEVDPRTASRRLVIGADNSASITVAELDLAWRPSVLFQVALEDATGNLGVTSLALSPEIGMGGFSLEIDDDGPAGLFQFVYAVATDGTVRVADVLDERRECDTQVDPRFARAASVRDLACLSIGTLMTPRRAEARGPGIRLPGEAIPLSVEFFRAAEPITDAQFVRAPSALLGHFAVITMSNGAVFLVNVDDDNYPDTFNANAPLDVPLPLAMAHQLRDVVGQRHVTIDEEDQPYVLDPEKGELGITDDRDCNYSGKFNQLGDAIGGPRAPAPPGRVVPSGTVATEKLTQLPGFRQLLCDRRERHGPKQTAADLKAITELAYAAPVEARDRSFPDLLALPATETWTLVWEGSLSLNTGSNDVDGPAVREGLLRSSSLGLHVLDEARPFCDAGVEPFDILELRGCDASIGAADCPSGYTCFVHPETKIPNFGTCMLPGEADRLADACRPFLTSRRRYTIKTTASGELVAVARRHELRTTPLDGCVSDQQCEALADYAARSSDPRHPSQIPVPERPATCGTGGCQRDRGEDHANCPEECAPDWSCVADPERAPMGGTGKRCELRCSSDADCAAEAEGTVCSGGFCMEGVVPSQSCINATQRFQLRAGEAFAVIGSQAGFVHPIIEDAAGRCVRDPMASRLSIGRLPLVPKDRFAPDTLHACDPSADPLTGRRADGTFEPNPCATTVPHIDVKPRYTPMTCSLASTEPLFEPRQAPAVQFRNRSLTLTLVDPYYPGDATCITDRQANLGQIPHVVPGTTLSVRVVGGFAPMRALTGITLLDSLPSFPVKVVRGPTQSLWVLDEGDFLSSSSSQASTRGKVLIFRPESPASGLVIK